jgi:hypothetical protein
MTHTYHFTRASANAKTGPIPVTTSSSSTCPTICPLRANGCYAEYGPLKLHWSAVDSGKRGGSLDALCVDIKALPKHQLWRWGQAGDLPGNGQLIDQAALRKVVAANGGRHGFAFTHYDPFIVQNAEAVRTANQAGFAVNLSANNLEHADRLHALGVAPVVVVLPKDTTKPFKTPAGNHVSVCPAAVREDVTCATCGICAVSSRKAIIGFPAHGTGANKAQAVLFMSTMTSTMTNEKRLTPFPIDPPKNRQRKRT